MKNTTFIYNKLLQIIKDKKRLLTDEPMKNHTTFRTGGPADIMVMPESVSELSNILQLICELSAESAQASPAEDAIPVFIIGNGSNILVRDGGIRGVVIKLGSFMSEIRVDGEKIIAGAGALMSAVAQAACQASLTGLEFASGIPGSIGGGVFMNAGAYGGELSQVVTSVKAVMPDGSVEIFGREQLDMGYRHSVFNDNDGIIVEVEMCLKKGIMEEINGLMKELNRRRVEKQPLSQPSAGSTFKRPEGYFAGKLIQDAGCKGLSVGGALVSPKHAGFIVNADNASAQDILDLIAIVQMRVRDKFGVKLETEVRITGE